ncbi:hypothetical protein [Corallococcus macrosporus]|uniref:Uncharacterized protein n=2 Tax=Myxococcaceae TaxID=31 RepID=A0A250K3M6_9BACT|nr:hypothetical protein [Corallococcus macrosporus]AEI64936.1 hypothetical protein LILAB_15155 [Corallococcus macrosporus]ATB50347.1 hypothetical protein MYMAC_006002 [Corallococcus macrosporus DSM 14697]
MKRNAGNKNTLNGPRARGVVEHLEDVSPDLPVVLGGIHPGGDPEHVFSACRAACAEAVCLRVTRARGLGVRSPWSHRDVDTRSASGLDLSVRGAW